MSDVCSRLRLERIAAKPVAVHYSFYLKQSWRWGRGEEESLRGGWGRHPAAKVGDSITLQHNHSERQKSEPWTCAGSVDHIANKYESY